MTGLPGRFAVVTGGGSGIGRAVAMRLAREGAAVAVLGRREDRLKEVASEILSRGGKATYAVCDVRDADSVAAAAAHVRGEHGRVDILVNNAGVYDGAEVLGTTEEEWDAVLDTNLKGAFLVTRALLPSMQARRGGWVINMVSWAGKDTAAGHSTYAASKWALRGWSESLGQELKAHGIRVAGVYPGSVNTAMQQGVPGALEPDDVAECVMFLLRLPERAYVDDITIVPTEYY